MTGKALQRKVIQTKKETLAIQLTIHRYLGSIVKSSIAIAA